MNEIFKPNLCIWLDKVLETNSFVTISLLYRVGLSLFSVSDGRACQGREYLKEGLLAKGISKNTICKTLRIVTATVTNLYSALWVGNVRANNVRIETT